MHAEAIRYRLRRGLLAEPLSPPGGIRRYDESHARRLRFIKHAQALGFGFDEVAELLELEDGQHYRGAERISTHKRSIVRQRIDHLRRIEQALATLVKQCHGNRGKVHYPLMDAPAAENVNASG